MDYLDFSISLTRSLVPCKHAHTLGQMGLSGSVSIVMDLADPTGHQSAGYSLIGLDMSSFFVGPEVGPQRLCW